MMHAAAVVGVVAAVVGVVAAVAAVVAVVVVGGWKKSVPRLIAV